MKSKTVRFKIEGGYGVELIGPKMLCGREQRGGVSIRRVDAKGNTEPGGVLTREETIRIHALLGSFIASWATETK